MILLVRETIDFLKFAAPGHYSPIPDIKKIRAKSDIVYDRSPKSLPGIDVNADAQVEQSNWHTNFLRIIRIYRSPSKDGMDVDTISTTITLAMETV